MVEISIKYSSLYNKFILLLSSLVLSICSLQLTQSYSKQNTSLFEKQKKIAGEQAKREIFFLFGEKNHFFCYSLKSAWKIRKTCNNHKTCFSDIRAEAGITLTDDCGNLLPDENHNLERNKELNRVRVTDKRLNFFVAIHCNLNTTKFTKILILIISRTDTKPHLAIDICQ